MVEKKQNWAKSLAQAMNMSTSIVAAIAIGLFAGRWLDGKLDTGYLMTMIGFVLGIASAGKMLWEKLMVESVQISKKKFKE